MPSTNDFSNSDLPYWLALWHTPGIGPVTFERLWKLFPELGGLFSTSEKQLQQLGLAPGIIAALKNPPWVAVKQALAWMQAPDHHILTWQSFLYPLLLKETVGAPPVLFVWGDPTILALPQVAIVGSRNPTPAGISNARDFSAELCATGLIVTSGLALGIDAVAHQAALKQGGKTIAVLGSGLEHIYPFRHKKLAAQIAEQGAVISELPLTTRPKAENFPQRNRIVSGLSLGVLVVEATLRSGSLITARLAAEQGREVFAIPGSIHNPLAQGCHALISQGAKLVESVQDICVEINRSLTVELVAPNTPKQISPKNFLAANYSQLLECVGYEATSIDLLVERTGLLAQEVAAMLLLLELQGYVTVVPGGYMRVNTL